MEGKTTYFDRPGQENTDAVFEIVRRRADELGIDTILVASTVGGTAIKAVGALKGLKVVIVTHNAGFKEPNGQEFTEEARRTCVAAGAKILTTTHAFAGVDRAMRKQFNTYMLGETIANTLRIFGQGTKVCCEIALMAADAGLARTGEEVIAVGGTGRGADTAIVLSPVNADEFFNLKVKEILCKPRQ